MIRVKFSRVQILLDCTPLSRGGGVQVAIALVSYLQRQTSITWRAILTEDIAPAFGDLALHPNVESWRKEGKLSRARIATRLLLLRLHRAFDVAFTIFGPPYAPLGRNHAVGFALPHLIYPEERLQIISRTSKSRWTYARRRLRYWFTSNAQRLLFRLGSRFVAETPVVAARAAAALGVSPDRFLVAANAVNPLFQQAYAKHSATVRSTDRPFTVLVPSAYYEHKNLEIVPEIAAVLRAERPNFKVRFLLTLNPEIPAVRSMMEEVVRGNLEFMVINLGTRPLDSLARDYHECDAVLLPTLLECSTAVYPEAFYAQRPVITSDREFARDACGDAALFAEPTSARAFADLVAILGEEENLRQRLVELGSIRLRSRYPDPDRKNEALLNELLKSTTH